MNRRGPAIRRAAEVRAADAALIHGVGIPSDVLLEHAAHGAAQAIAAWAGTPQRTLVLCGPGNNGGDGYAIARHLALRGWEVRAWPVLPPASSEARLTHSIAEQLGLVGPLSEPELVIDAVFGTGQRAPLDLPVLPPLGRARVVSIDVPTGIDADTGARVGSFPAPDWCVCIGARKPFLFRDATPHGFVDIGLDWRAPAPEAVLVESAPWLPPVPRDANKWRRGHVGVRAGSPEKAGAAVLACWGALRGGAGLVTLFIEREAWSRLASLPPEVMVAEPTPSPKVDALVVGPGLGRLADSEVRRLWAQSPLPAVFDADGLRALEGIPSAHPRILTPHAGEAAALLGSDWRELEADRFQTTRRLSALGTVIYKGACPVVSGSPLAVLAGGVPALGTGGSGDVLAGLVGALLATSANEGAPDASVASGPKFEAIALAAAWLHQEAARSLAIGATAREIADAIPATRQRQ